MGLTYLRIQVADPAKPELWEGVEFLIDSGAVHSVVPGDVVQRLALRTLSTQEFRLAYGGRITRDLGAALFRYEERFGAATVIFGEEGDMPLLGITTLEGLGLGLDPLKRELTPLPMVL